MPQKKNLPVPCSEKMLLTAKEMSRVSGIGENTLRHLMDIGKLEVTDAYVVKQSGTIITAIKLQRSPRLTISAGLEFRHAPC